MIDFNKLKDTWKQSEHLSKTKKSETNEALKQNLRTVTDAQWKIKKYFKFEMAVAITAILAFAFAVLLTDELEPYFYKLFALVVIGSVPLNVRLFLSMKRILGIDYANQLQKNLISAKNHLKTTIRIYYTLVVLTVFALVLMSLWDDYFLQLPTAWQGGIMSYFLLFLIVVIYFVNKSYGSKLKVLEELLENM